MAAQWRPEVGMALGGRFVLERLVGVTSYGELFAARDERLGGPVRVKCFHPSFFTAEVRENQEAMPVTIRVEGTFD